MHLSTHHQKCKPPRKLTLLSNFEKKKVFKKSTDKEMLLPTGFSKWHELFLGVVQAFSLHSLFDFIKLILYKRALELCGLHLPLKNEKKKKKKRINLEMF